MKKIIIILLLIFSIQTSFGQFGYKKWYFSAGATAKYMQAEKYSGYDFNLTFIPRYNFIEINQENTFSIEIRPQIGIGTRNWYIYRAYDETFPTRLSYSMPILINYNSGLNSEENSLFLLGFYIGGGYGITNVLSNEPPYEPIHGFVIDAGIRIDGSPISHLGTTYTIGQNGDKVFSFGFFYDF
jgi:hypothetical protein